jgi:hypothetical protein
LLGLQIPPLDSRRDQPAESQSAAELRKHNPLRGESEWQEVMCHQILESIFRIFIWVSGLFDSRNGPPGVEEMRSRPMYLQRKYLQRCEKNLDALALCLPFQLRISNRTGSCC